MESGNLKWQKLLWAVVIVTAIYVGFSILINRSKSELGSFPYIIIGWWAAIITGIAALMLRIMRVVMNSDSFIYILIGTFNLLIGLLDIYFTINGDDIGTKWIFLGLLPFVLSVVIYYDFLKKEHD